jgi:hypothetical protein
MGIYEKYWQWNTIKIKMGRKIKIAIKRYISVSDFIVKQMCLQNCLWLPHGSPGLCGTQNTPTWLLNIITSNFNRKSTTYTKRKVAKARPGILELPRCHHQKQQNWVSMSSISCSIESEGSLEYSLTVPVHTIDMMDWRYNPTHSQPQQWASRTDRPGEEVKPHSSQAPYNWLLHCLSDCTAFLVA